MRKEVSKSGCTCRLQKGHQKRPIKVTLHADGLHATQVVNYGLPIGQAESESDEGLVSCSLPLQIGLALFLLYMQVKFAFLAGLAVVLLLIPSEYTASSISSAEHEESFGVLLWAIASP